MASPQGAGAAPQNSKCTNRMAPGGYVADMTPPPHDRPSSAPSVPAPNLGRDRAALLERLAENAPIGIFLTDAMGRPVYLNPRFAEITGRSAEWLMRDEWALMVHPDDRTRVLATIAD